jgi:hypothetical protein
MARDYEGGLAFGDSNEQRLLRVRGVQRQVAGIHLQVQLVRRQEQ